MVQVSETWLPVRVAARSVTGSGNLSEGGSGAPGVPQPVANRAAADRAAHPNLDTGFIAIPVYWSGAGCGLVRISIADAALVWRCHGALQLSVDGLWQLAILEVEFESHGTRGWVEVSAL
jgi:hypothetical protein